MEHWSGTPQVLCGFHEIELARSMPVMNHFIIKKRFSESQRMTAFMESGSKGKLG